MKKIKIILGIEDIKKLINEAYNGVNSVSIEAEELDFVLDVDGDTFSKKSLKAAPITVGGGPVDFEAKLAEKQALRTEITGETESIIPEVKSLDERNAEAAKKGLMTTGRGSSRPMRKF